MRERFFSLCRRFGPTALFCGLVAFGLCIYRDFGSYIDEFTNHYFGVTWYKYAHAVIAEHAPLGQLPAITQHDIVHGPVVEMVLAWIESHVPSCAVIRNFVFFRHAATWVIFCLGVMSFYFLARRLFASRRLGLLAAFFLVLHPRIFSHAFYDSVDIPLLALYACSLHTLVRYLERRTPGALCLHALACALLVDIRLIGAVIPAMTLAVLAAETILPRPPVEGLRHRLGKIGLYVVLVGGLIIAFWPYLWTNPFARMLEVIRQTPRVGWGGTVLYLGREIRADTIPWHYIPVWIAITTPVAYLGLFAVGLVAWLGALVRKPVEFYRERMGELVILAAFLGPLLAVIVLKAELYDGWRHMYFLYPPFVLIAVGGLRVLFRWSDLQLKAGMGRVAKGVVVGLIAVNLMTVGWFMIKYHPYQNVYFNRFAGPDMPEIKRRFELDYWGLSYRNALEHLLASDPSDSIAVYRNTDSLLAINWYILPSAGQQRIKQVGYDEAKYILTTYRGARGGYPTLEEYFSIKVDGVNILGIYRKAPAVKATPGK